MIQIMLKMCKCDGKKVRKSIFCSSHTERQLFTITQTLNILFNMWDEVFFLPCDLIEKKKNPNSKRFEPEDG